MFRHKRVEMRDGGAPKRSWCVRTGAAFSKKSQVKFISCRRKVWSPGLFGVKTIWAWIWIERSHNRNIYRTFPTLSRPLPCLFVCGLFHALSTVCTSSTLRRGVVEGGASVRCDLLIFFGIHCNCKRCTDPHLLHKTTFHGHFDRYRLFVPWPFTVLQVFLCDISSFYSSHAFVAVAAETNHNAVGKTCVNDGCVHNIWPFPFLTHERNGSEAPNERRWNRSRLSTQWTECLFIIYSFYYLIGAG